jgi:hypothetical protein
MGQAKQRRVQFSELVELRPDQISGTMCAWEGCTATFKHTHGGQPPNGWRILYTMKKYDAGQLPSGEPVMRIFSKQAGFTRDACLCPHHAEALERQLKPLCREVMAEAEGTA